MKRAVAGIVLVVISLMLIYNVVTPHSPPEILSPQGTQDPKLDQLPVTYDVYGFAPYWNLQKTIIQPELTHLVYFSLPITPDGKLDGINTTGPSISRTRWESQRLATVAAQLRSNQKFAITFTQFNNQAIEQLLGSPESKLQFRQSVEQLLKESSYPISAINIDIEYTGESTSELRQQYVEFVKVIKEISVERVKLGAAPVELSICVFATAANRQLIWNLKALEPIIDKVVMMAYDFHRPSSTVAGPVAPMFGGKTQWSSDIIGNLQAFSAIFPSRKILLGVPFYGYEWETTSDSPVSSTFPGTGSTASYTRVQQLLKKGSELNLAQQWSEDSLSPYVTFTRGERSHVIHYDDARSLSYKLDLVKDAQLGGIAIWALGYEADSRELWDVIQHKFTLPKMQ